MASAPPTSPPGGQFLTDQDSRQIRDSESQSERAYRVLRLAIANLELSPAEPLSESVLAQRYGFGRTPIREATHRLRQDGLIEAVPRRGLFVSSVDAGQVRDILEMLEALDGMGTYLAAQRADERSLERLEHVHQLGASAVAAGDSRSWQLHNFEFHQELAEMAGNARLKQCFDLLHDQLRRVLLLTLAFRNPSRAVEEHQGILAAMRSGDAEGARQLTQAHRKRARAEIMGIIDSIPLSTIRY
jgi:GntR family transcriptional regulator, rspAB operon transcriptional repressor